jgi:NAD-dependent deacetylase
MKCEFSRFDPSLYCDFEIFQSRPDLFWSMTRALVLEIHENQGGDGRKALKTGQFLTAKPNSAHTALAELESFGLVRCIITQNIDGLHQLAGSRNVVELHGNSHTCTCTCCHASVPMSEALKQWVSFTAGRPASTAILDVGDGFVPRHDACGGGVLKGDVTMFGEPLPSGTLWRAATGVLSSPVCMVVGSSLRVAPASMVPSLARLRFGRLLLCDADADTAAAVARAGDVVLGGEAGTVLPRVVRRVKELRAAGRLTRRAPQLCACM